MKQAYTNTIRHGGGRPLAIATVKKGKGHKEQLPMCAYGAACTRKGCAYRHPSKKETYDNYYDDPKSKICKPYLVGLCTFGRKCMCRHPGKEEADAVRASYKTKLCSHGDECMTEGCLYFHPWEAKEEEYKNGPENSNDHGDDVNVNNEFTEQELEALCAEVGEINIQNSTNSNASIPTYDQWVAMNYPQPITMDPTQAYNLWYFPGSAMRRHPYEVYTLMYPPSQQQQQQQQQHCQIIPPPQSYEPYYIPNNTNDFNFQQQQQQQQQNEYYYNEQQQQQQQQEPTTFQEWKAMGCPYPSWFYSEYDPWYDDEGLRRSMEDVYELLFGSRVDETFARQQQEQIEAFPTPAEQFANDRCTSGGTCTSAASTGVGQTKTTTTTPTMTSNVNANTTTSTGGWASIAAKPAAPTSTSTRTSTASKNHTGINTKSKSIKYSNKSKQKMVPIPKEVWLPDTSNANFFHLYPDPIDRFHAVNDFHKPYLANITIPLCFHIDNEDGSSTTTSTSSGKVALLDVHFQSAKTITTVLNHFLPSALKQNEEVWIITGSGHHVATGHQRRESGGVLFNAVKKYLEEKEENDNDGGKDDIEFRVGKDTSSGRNKISGGAFLVRKKRI